MNFIKNIKLSAMMLLVLPCMVVTSDVEKLNDAIDASDITIITHLLTKVDVNSKDDQGCTFLQNAIPDGSLEVVQLLIESGADVNAVDNDGFTALDSILLNLVEGIGMCYADRMECMIEQGYFEEYILIAQYLIQSGADLSLKHDLRYYLTYLNLDEVNTDFMNSLSGDEKEAFINQSQSMTILEIVTSVKNEYVYLMNSDVNMDDRNKEALQSLLGYINKLQVVLEQAA